MTDQEVLDALPDTDKQDAPDRYTSKSGVVLALKRVPPFLVRDAQRNLKRPKPPVVFIEEKGAEEENPADPDYIEELERFQEKLGDVANGVYMVRGTRVLTVPEGMEKADGTEWSSQIAELTGLEIPESGYKRYFAWLKYVALDTMDDFFGVIGKIAMLGGVVKEADVAQAMETFRGDEVGDADRESVPEAGAVNGDTNTTGEAGRGS